MHLKLKLEDKISQGKYEMMTKRSNLQRKKLISLRCQCTKYTKEHNALIYLFFKIFGNNTMHFWVQGRQCTALLYVYKKKGHAASRHLLGFGKSLCFNWVGST